MFVTLFFALCIGTICSAEENNFKHIPECHRRTKQLLHAEGPELHECFSKATWQSKIFTKELKESFAQLLKKAELENGTSGITLTEEELRKRNNDIAFLSDKIESLLSYNYCSNACKDDVESFLNELKTWSRHQSEEPQSEESRTKLLNKLKKYQEDLAKNDKHHRLILGDY